MPGKMPSVTPADPKNMRMTAIALEGEGEAKELLEKE